MGLRGSPLVGIMADLELTFGEIYRRNLWNGVESLSGPGSGVVPTEPVAQELTALVLELDVRTVLDVGCGDGLWMPDLPGYLGVDVAPAAVERARKLHPDRHYRVWDGRRLLGLEPFDLVICRDAMQHLPLADGLAILDAIRDTGSRWLLASTYRGTPNCEVVAGAFYSPNLTGPPFGLPEPARTIFDGYDYGIPDQVRDPAKFLGLWPLTA